MIPLKYVLRNAQAATKFMNCKKKINRLIYVGDIIKIFSQDIEMEFGIEKCPILIMSRGKRQITERMEQPNQEK